MVITDGKWSNASPANVAAKWNKIATLIVLGIGNGIKPADLAIIANGNTDMVFSVETMPEVLDVMDSLVTKSCAKSKGFEGNNNTS